MVQRVLPVSTASPFCTLTAATVPSCGAQMTFSPEKQALVCGHCGTEKEVDFSDDVRERSFEELYLNLRHGDGKAIRKALTNRINKWFNRQQYN